MEADKHIDNLLEALEKIEYGKVTILTGSNGAGKSFIRKQVAFHLADKEWNGKKIEFNKIVASTSMQQRTESRPEFGAFSGIMRDDPWVPTSMATYRKIKALLGQFKDETYQKYIVIDEPEIGMGEETIMGLVGYLSDTFSILKRNPNFMGALIITHSRLVCRMNHDAFVNMENMNESDWLNREIIPASLEQIDERSTEIFRAIQDRMNAQKKENNGK